MASNKRKAGSPGEGRPQNYLRSGTLTYASPADAAETGSDPHRIIIAEDLLIGARPDLDCDNAHNPPKNYAKREYFDVGAFSETATTDSIKAPYAH